MGIMFLKHFFISKEDIVVLMVAEIVLTDLKNNYNDIFNYRRRALWQE
jgi:hypothetical protein